MSSHARILVIALAACGDPAHALPDAPTPIDAAPVCAPITGAGTMHRSITAPETWKAADSPHIVPFDIELTAAVTVEPCSVITMAAGTTITLSPGGKLDATGTATQRIAIQAQGMPWSSIRELGGDLVLAHVDVSGGGAPGNTNPAFAGALHLQTGTLHVDDVDIAGSGSQGVYINGPTGFDATSQNLRVHGAAGYPVHVYARVIGSIPSGTYTGNGHDAIAIAGAGGPVISDQTLHDRGVPYHVGSGPDGGRLDIDTQVAGTVAVLTIEPGVTMQFPPGGTLNVGLFATAAPATGAVIAIGTAAKPIVFGADDPAAIAGAWLGIGFGGIVDARTVMQHARVEFAGGSTVTGSQSCPYPGRVGPNYAAIRIFGPATTQFITQTEIPQSARDGIDRGWRADLQPDFLATNTITVTGCKETTPATAANVCPPSPPCP